MYGRKRREEDQDGLLLEVKGVYVVPLGRLDEAVKKLQASVCGLRRWA